MEVRTHGFSLLELMIVIAVIAVLSMIAIPTYRSLVARSKRSEAYAHLHSLYIAEQAYHAEHAAYSDRLSGESGIGWEPQGGHMYTYGFATGGSDSSKEGSLHAPASTLGQTHASKDSFVAAAAGDIDGDGMVDVLTIDQTGQIKIIQDDTKGGTSSSSGQK